MAGDFQKWEDCKAVNLKDCRKCAFDGECVLTPDVCKGFSPKDMWRQVANVMESKGEKHDQGKLDWYALPLELLEPLAELMLAGEKKYGGGFNCLEHFDDPNRRFWSANMRHAEKCQKDPLARDPETGCYHEAARAFSSLMRIYHCRKEAEGERR